SAAGGCKWNSRALESVNAKDDSRHRSFAFGRCQFAAGTQLQPTSIIPAQIRSTMCGGIDAIEGVVVRARDGRGVFRRDSGGAECANRGGSLEGRADDQQTYLRPVRGAPGARYL